MEAITIREEAEYLHPFARDPWVTVENISVLWRLPGETRGPLLRHVKILDSVTVINPMLPTDLRRECR